MELGKSLRVDIDRSIFHCFRYKISMSVGESTSDDVWRYANHLVWISVNNSVVRLEIKK